MRPGLIPFRLLSPSSTRQPLFLSWCVVVALLHLYHPVLQQEDVIQTADYSHDESPGSDVVETAGYSPDESPGSDVDQRGSFC